MAYSEKSNIIFLEKCEEYSTKKQYTFCISLNISQKGPKLRHKFANDLQI